MNLHSRIQILLVSYYVGCNLGVYYSKIIILILNDNKCCLQCHVCWIYVFFFNKKVVWCGSVMLDIKRCLFTVSNVTLREQWHPEAEPHSHMLLYVYHHFSLPFHNNFYLKIFGSVGLLKKIKSPILFLQSVIIVY